jgi:hypothetical protein
VRDVFGHELCLDLRRVEIGIGVRRHRRALVHSAAAVRVVEKVAEFVRGRELPIDACVGRADVDGALSTIGK